LGGTVREAVKLVSVIAALAALLASSALTARGLDRAAGDSLTFVQISDLHLSRGRSLDIERLERAVQEINSMAPPPGFVIFTGDIAWDVPYAEEAYLEVRRATRKFNMPVYFAVGNHDDRRAFRAIILGEKNPRGEPYYYSFGCGGFRFIVLDSVVEGRLEGTIDDRQLGWMQNEIRAHPEQGAFLFMHHHAYPVGTEVDQFILTHHASFRALLSRFPQVRLVASGHTHFSHVVQEGGVYYVSTRAFSEGLNAKGEPPAYRVFSIDNSGIITSRERVVK
jgi:3',5'-cyclic-AMP phosphodiesterase